MAKAPKKTRKPVQINIGQDDDIPEIIDLDAHEEAYIQLRTELATDEGCVIEINRQVGRTTREVEWMDAVPLADFPDLLQLKQMVANTYGAGLYVMKLRYQGKFKKHFQLKIGARVTLPAQQGGDAQGLAALFESFSTKLYDALKTAAPPRNQLEDFTMYMRLARELNGGGGGAMGGMDPWQLMDRIEKLADKRARALIGQEPEGPGERHWALDVLDKMTPVLQEGIAALRDTRVVSVQEPVAEQAATQHASTGDAAQQQHHTPGDKPMSMIDIAIANVLKPYLPFLNFINLNASEDGDVEAYAVVLLDRVPESIKVPGMGEVALTDEVLIKALNRPDAMDLFIRAYPPAGQFRAWYARLLPVVLSLLVPEKPGDGGNPS